MPKTKKRKPSELVKDFSPQKTKLGAGKKATANNATNTSFKARSIALTQQSITKDRSTAPTSKRNLTIEELLAQTRHYSASVRRDALHGLKDVYQTYPSLKVAQIGRIIPCVSRLVSDDDVSVRSTLHSFLHFYINSVPSYAMQPYASSLVLHVTSAMSHIYPDVRFDAVRILDLLYPVFGASLSSGWDNALHKHTTMSSSAHRLAVQRHGERLLSSYLSLLAITDDLVGGTSLAGSAQVASNDVPIGARLLILRSLTRLVEPKSTPGNHSEERERELACPTWFWHACFKSVPELCAFRSSLSRHDCKTTGGDELYAFMSDIDGLVGGAWNAIDIYESFGTATTILLDKDRHTGPKSDDDSSARRRLFHMISPLLIATFLDAAPIAFASAKGSSKVSPLDVSTQLVCSIASLALTLWRNSTASHADERVLLGKLLTHMSVYFPFAHEGVDRSRAEIVTLNLCYCELVGLFVVTEGNTKAKATVPAISRTESVSSFVLQLLSDESKPDRVQQPILRGQTYLNLLPTIWLLLNDSAYRKVESLTEALLSHWTSLKASEPTKRTAAEFIGRLWLLQGYRSYHGFFAIRPASSHRTRLVAWLVQAVPRYLWELHGRDAKTSAMLIDLLRLACCQNNGLMITSSELASLCRSLVPFFQSRHPTKGFVMGPYARLPDTVQAEARALLFTIPSLEGDLQEAAAAAGAYP